MARGLMLAFAAMAGLLLASWMVVPSRALPADAPADLFSAGRAMRDVREIARAPHAVGTAENERVIGWIAHRLTALGTDVALQPVPLDDMARAKLAKQSRASVPAGIEGTNVLGLIRGRDRTQPAVLLMAHHDTVWGSPGAADDTSGVAAILEIVRALKSGPQPERDVVALLTDGEEMGLSGAKAFFASPLRAHVGVAINLETRGGGGRALMFETSPGNGGFVRAYARAVPWPSASSLSVLVYRLLPNSTDLTPAIRSGVFGMNFAFAGRAGLYHSPLSTPDRIDPASIQDIGQQALATTRALALGGPLPGRAPDLVFGDLWGSRLLAYPTAGGWVLLGVSLLLVGFAVLRVRRSGVAFGSKASWLAPPLLLLAGLPLFLVNRLSGAGAGANYYDRLAALPRLEVQAAAIGVAALLLVAGWRRIGRWGGWFALMAIAFVIGVAIQIAVPAAGPLFHWPILLAALAMASAAALDPSLSKASALAPAAALAAVGIGQVLGLGHLLFLFVGAGTPEATLIQLLLVALLVWPLVQGQLTPRAMALAAGLALLVAVSIAGWVRFDPIAPSVPVYDNDKH